MTDKPDDTLSVFLSHSSKDKRIVHTIAEGLKDYGVSVFLDDVDMVVGESLGGRLREAIALSDYLLVAVSENSSRSRWVAEEIRIAQEMEAQTGRTIVMPVLIDDVTKVVLDKLIGDRLFADFRDPKEFDFAMTALLRSMSRLEPVAVLLNRLEEQIYMRTHDIEQMYEGRALLRELSFYREMEVPDYRDWLFWELCWEILDGSYPVQVTVGIFEGVAYCRTDDSLLGTPAYYSVPLNQVDLGVWRLENPTGLLVSKPHTDDEPFVVAERFAISHGVPMGDGPAIKRNVVANESGLREVIKNFRPRMRAASHQVLECMLADLHALTLQTIGRPTNVEIGIISYSPMANDDGEFPRCAFDGTDEARTCSGADEGILFVQIEDIFFGSFNGIFLCSSHREDVWVTNLNLLRSYPSNSVRKNESSSLSELRTLLAGD